MNRAGATIPAQERAYPRQHLAGVEGLGHVVVGPQLQPQDLVRVLDARRDHNNGQIGQIGVSADRACEIPSVAIRQHQIQQEQRRPIPAEHVQRGFAVVRNVHIKLRLFQVAAQKTGNFLVIVHHQNRFVGHELLLN